MSKPGPRRGTLLTSQLDRCMGARLQEQAGRILKLSAVGENILLFKFLGLYFEPHFDAQS